MKERKKPVYGELDYRKKKDGFVRKWSDWRKRLLLLAFEMTMEHEKLSEVRCKDRSTAVMYQEFLATSIQFINRANETLEEYASARLENLGCEPSELLSLLGQQNVSADEAAQSPGAAPNTIDG